MHDLSRARVHGSHAIVVDLAFIGLMLLGWATLMGWALERFVQGSMTWWKLVGGVLMTGAAWTYIVSQNRARSTGMVPR